MTDNGTALAALVLGALFLAVMAFTPWGRSAVDSREVKVAAITGVIILVLWTLGWWPK